MKNYLLAKSETIHKCRHKLGKHFGVYWYERLTKSEWDEKKGAVCQLIEGVHTDDELTDFMSK